MSGNNFFAFMTISKVEETCLPLGDVSLETIETAWVTNMNAVVDPSLIGRLFNFDLNNVTSYDLTNY